MFCKESEDDALAEAAEAKWEESWNDEEQEEGCASLLVNEVSNEYGIGRVLLQNMGWRPGMHIGGGTSSAPNVPIERSEANYSRAGVGHHSRDVVPIPTFKECLNKVHNDGTCWKDSILR
jgi:hypothetical protein